MPTLAPRDFQQIAPLFDATASFEVDGVPMYMRGIMAHFGGRTLAGDFVLLDAKMADRYNTHVATQSPAVHNEWYVFAVSGQGDLWLAHKKRDSVAFYDHDRERLAPDNLHNLELGIRDWIVLADLIGRYEQALDDGEAPDDPAAAIDRIQPGLWSRLPFDVEG